MPLVESRVRSWSLAEIGRENALLTKIGIEVELILPVPLNSPSDGVGDCLSWLARLCAKWMERKLST